jgi:hypothetical protein
MARLKLNRDDRVSAQPLRGDVLLRRRRDTWIGYQGFAIAAYVLAALTVFKSIEIGVAVAATGLLIASRAGGTRGPNTPERMRAAALIAAGFLLAVGLAAWLLGPFVAAIAAILTPLALWVGYLAMRGKLEELGPRMLATALLVIMVLTIGFVRIVAYDPPVIDVLDLHIAAADALLDGDNPYTDVAVVDTSPTAEEGDLWVGYPYPPLTLAAYAGAEILFGDPRWASVIAVIVAVVLIARPWQALTRPQAGALIALALALVTQPMLGDIVRSAWTDPIAIPLLVGGGLLWRRNPALSAVLLGLAFGTKQYFILALPLLLVWGDDYRWKRTAIASGVAALTVLPAFVAHPRGAWEALVAALLDTPLRLDSIGMAGIGFDIPFWLMLVASVGVALWMGWRGGPASRFMLGLSATVAVALLLGSQAFLNYWFFVGAVVIVALASDELTIRPTVASNSKHP